MLPYLMFTLMVISLIILIYFDYKPMGYMGLIFKTTTSLLFIATCVASYINSSTDSKYFVLILIALIFSLSGDVFLALYNKEKLQMPKFFFSGVISFAIAHLFFSFAFVSLSPLLMKDIIVFVLISILSITFLRLVKRFNFNGLFNLVAIYAIIISFMLTKALSLYELLPVNFKGITLIIVGAILFFISDFILSFIYFDKDHHPCLSALNLSTYYIGQGLIALSLIASL